MSTTQAKNFNLELVQWFVIIALVYLAVGAFIGVYLGAVLTWPAFSLDIPYLTFDHLRSLHTNASIFAFGGCVLLASTYYSVQRTCDVKLWSDMLGWFAFWGWNLIIVFALISLLFSPRELGTSAWIFDIAIALVWAAVAINLVMTLAQHKTSLIYSSNWFFLGMILLVAYLYVTNILSITSNHTILHSLQSSGGMLNAIKAHYTDNFFYLTVGFLGIIYYFVPKQANTPLYSHRLSLVHFWGLMFVCVWLGMRQLQHPSMPDWHVGPDFSINLLIIILSLVGALNVKRTMPGSWNKLRTDYILRFLTLSFVIYVACSFYDILFGFAIGHVHLGELGCVVIASSGALYHMVEKLWKSRMYSANLVNLHFWASAIGTIIYVIATQAATTIQAVQLGAPYNDAGQLSYTFAEAVEALHPSYMFRFVGGALYTAGIILMLYNIVMTIRRSGDRITTAERT